MVLLVDPLGFSTTYITLYLIRFWRGQEVLGGGHISIPQAKVKGVCPFLVIGRLLTIQLWSG